MSYNDRNPSEVLRPPVLSARRRIDSMRIFFICLFSVVLFARSQLYYNLNDPFAEVFTDLLLGALSSPFDLLRPIVDGYFLLSRALASIAVGFDELHAPLLLILLSCVAHAIVSTFILKRSFVWLFPSEGFRLLLSFFIAFGPGSAEIAGNAICISYSFALLLLLMSLEERPPTIFGIFGLIILASSSNFAPIVSLGFFMRACLPTSAQFRRKWLCCGFWVAAPQFIGQLFYSVISATGSRPHYDPLPLDRLRSLPKYFYIEAEPKTLIAAIVLLFAVIATGELIRREPKLLPTPLGISGCVIAIGLLATSVTFQVLHFFLRGYGPGMILERTNSLIFIPILLAIAVVAFSCTTLSFKVWRLTTPSMLILMSIACPLVIAMEDTWSRLERPRAESRHSWSSFLQQLDSASDDAFQTLAIDPYGSDKPWATLTCRQDDRITRCNVHGGNRNELEYVFSH